MSCAFLHVSGVKFDKESFRRSKDPRNRRDYTEKLVTVLAGQMEDMTDAYMGWASTNGGLDKRWDGSTNGEVDSLFPVKVVDIFGEPFCSPVRPTVY